MFDLISIGDSSMDSFLILNQNKERSFSDIDKKRHELCFSFESKIPVMEVLESIGGNAANVAAGISRLGYKCALLSHIGHDEPGRKLFYGLRAEGISLGQLFIDKDRATNRSTILALYGERIIFSHHEEREYTWPKRLPVSRWLYLTSMGKGHEKIFEPLVDFADRNQTMIAYSPGSYQLSIGPQKSGLILKRAKVLFLNKDEAEEYTLSDSAISPLKLLEKLKKLGPEIVVMTDGRNGAYAMNNTRALWIDLTDKRTRREATGAGDSFAAGTLSALMRDLMLEEALLWGMLNSAAVVQEIGAVAGLLTLKELQKRLKVTEPRIKEL